MGARTRGAVGVLTAALATAAHAQPARLVGAVVDSLRGGMLSGATVMVMDGGARQADTDSTGRFRIDSIPPGVHRIAALHPLLDTLDIAVVSPPITFAAGGTVNALLATPSPGRLLRILCPDDSLQPTAILGRVLGAENGQAVPDASVTLTWATLAASRATGVSRQMHTRVARTNVDGRFRLCSPSGVTAGMVRATRAGVATGGVSLALGQGIAILVLRLANDSATSGHAIAAGRVVGSHDTPVIGAVVTVAGTAARTETHDSGTFTLTDLPAGTRNLSVTAIGYAPTTIAVNLLVGTPWHGVIQLTPAPPTLATVHVTAAQVATGYAAIGFTERRGRGVGTFMTADDIERKRPTVTSDLFRDVPGVYLDRSFSPPLLVGSRGRTSLKGASGACVNLWVDGHRVIPVAVTMPGGDAKPYTPLPIDDYVPLVDVVGVEVYNTSEIPARFQTTGESCQVVVVWTKGAITVAPATP